MATLRWTASASRFHSLNSLLVFHASTLPMTDREWSGSIAFLASFFFCLLMLILLLMSVHSFDFPALVEHLRFSRALSRWLYRFASEKPADSFLNLSVMYSTSFVHALRKACLENGTGEKGERTIEKVDDDDDDDDDLLLRGVDGVLPGVGSEDPLLGLGRRGVAARLIVEGQQLRQPELLSVLVDE